VTVAFHSVLIVVQTGDKVGGPQVVEDPCRRTQNLWDKLLYLFNVCGFLPTRIHKNEKQSVFFLAQQG
jgi:hypothetical protein